MTLDSVYGGKMLQVLSNQFPAHYFFVLKNDIIVEVFDNADELAVLYAGSRGSVCVKFKVINDNDLFLAYIGDNVGSYTYLFRGSAREIEHHFGVMINHEDFSGDVVTLSLFL